MKKAIVVTIMCLELIILIPSLIVGFLCNFIIVGFNKGRERAAKFTNWLDEVFDDN